MRGKLLMVLAVTGAAGYGSPAGAAAIADRTVRASETSAGEGLNRPSTRPVITATGTMVAFTSDASNLDGEANAFRDVFTKDLTTGRVRIVSVGPGGRPGNGPSEEASISARGERVVFSSRASNLVAGDGNLARDIFARDGGLPAVRVSLAHDGAEPDGPSYEPDVSRDGRFVVFTSLATNLVPGDDNGVEDVFVRDLLKNGTRRVSEAGGRAVKGRSRAPSISPDGRYVSFESTARGLVRGDRNRVADVFLADLHTRRIRRVSVSSSEREQNRAVAAGFVTVSDVSANGRYVAWDSDATNLVRRDRNRDTDVFVRDVGRGRTLLASRSSTGAQGDNDSYFPRISSDGRYVAFSSFARNLWPVDRGGEDVFVHDRVLKTSTVLTVNGTGERRGPERTRQLLRRASFSEGAGRVAFTSSATLSGDDANRHEDVFVRRTDAPDARIRTAPRGTVRSRRPRLRLTADDRRAVFLCRVDRRRPYFCPHDGRLPRLSRGRHRLTIRAGGPGMLFERKATIVTFRVR